EMRDHDKVASARELDCLDYSSDAHASHVSVPPPSVKTALSVGSPLTVSVPPNTRWAHVRSSLPDARDPSGAATPPTFRISGEVADAPAASAALTTNVTARHATNTLPRLITSLRLCGCPQRWRTAWAPAGRRTYKKP